MQVGGGKNTSTSHHAGDLVDVLHAAVAAATVDITVCVCAARTCSGTHNLTQELFEMGSFPVGANVSTSPPTESMVVPLLHIKAEHHPRLSLVLNHTTCRVDMGEFGVCWECG